MKKWTASTNGAGELRYIVSCLQPGTRHKITLNEKELNSAFADSEGTASFRMEATPGAPQIFSLE